MKLPIQVNDLKNKVAVITGAGGVLCSMMAKALASAGAKVALLDRSDKAQQFADEIKAEGGTAKRYYADVLKKETLAACHAEILKDFGKCDILINGAGGNNPAATTDKEYFELGD